MTEQNHEQNYGRLIVWGADRPGIVANVSAVLAEHGANVISLDQSSSGPEGGRFFQRTVFHLPELSAEIGALSRSLEANLGEELGLEFQLVEARRRKRVAVFVSRADHCLLDLLWRQRRGELPVTVSMVVSNHPDLGDDVRQFDIPFYHVPVDKDDKATAEREQLNLLKDNVDLLVLARYMQIVSGDFLDELGVPVINIHHSFLPAFVGASPYQQAKERGVKLVGATAHYVTEDLDEGPIIEQDVIRVSHRESVRDLQRKGADVERLVLSRAVSWHCEDRVIRDGNTTVVFQGGQ
ncbi:formyltetrahydrofolate deformylase [Saccharopolyspora lacisalsi]|uniref:Formyltetrahydrofolate deformylase n=1 Tax=Halosaccharopolyspora lacisalsi TaxID=1000566 RepID=A0A839DU98_9PSEU|nr:formyltetrahydrofolate deformylase [Halosaccharopolyspora lacisalsi]MBA8824319.1 formyltetrahydrofolate deformylase [Halosaccharopolyspora lacisalsi]